MVERAAVNPPEADSSPARRGETGKFAVYVIRSLKTGRVYIGQTRDLERRLRQHNDPENTRSLYTKRHPGPWMPVWEERFESRREAMARERWLKSDQGRLWLTKRLEGRKEANPTPP